jgi:molybdate transport system substrate-binding protein
MRMAHAGAAALFGLSGLLLAGATQAGEITVMVSPAFKEAYVELVPAFERATENKVATLWVGNGAIITRLKGGETVDLAILSEDGIDELAKLGKLAPGVPLGKSPIGVAVRAGAPKPDISSGEAVKRALLAAKSIALSFGPSGVYLSGLIQKWGIAADIAPKTVRPATGEMIGDVVARGGAEIGVQQVSELLAIKGITYLGPLPPDIQQITVFSAAVHNSAKNPDGAKALIRFLTSPQAAPVVRKTGMEPG